MKRYRVRVAISLSGQRLPMTSLEVEANDARAAALAGAERIGENVRPAIVDITTVTLGAYTATSLWRYDAETHQVWQ